MSFSRLECVAHDTCGIFYFHWDRHQIDGPTVFSVSSERNRYTVESQVFSVPGPSGDRTPAGSVPSGRANHYTTAHLTSDLQLKPYIAQ